jgi:transcriptional regulator with XRE-family HTH domain
MGDVMTIYIKYIRERKNLTLAQLEKLSGVSKSQINYIENGDSIPTISVLCRLAKALQVPITDLFSCD